MVVDFKMQFTNGQTSEKFCPVEAQGGGALQGDLVKSSDRASLYIQMKNEREFDMDYQVKMGKNRKFGMPKDQTKLIRCWLWLVGESKKNIVCEPKVRVR